MKKIFVLSFWCLLAACALGGSATYSEQLQQWVGRPEYQLYQEWGAPIQSFYVTPYEKVVTYVRTSGYGSNNPYSNQLYYQGMDPEDGWWDKMFGPPAEKQSRNYYCKSMNVAVNSTVGAGDGMVAAAALKLQEDAPLSEILRAGVAAGTATVMTTGQTSFTKEKFGEVLSNLRVTEI